MPQVTVDFPFRNHPDLLRVKMPGDGACLFHSVYLGDYLSDQGQLEAKLVEVRRLLENYHWKTSDLAQITQAFREFVASSSLNFPNVIPPGMTQEEVIDMCDSRTYGGQPQLYVSSSILKKQIHTYNATRPLEPPMMYNGDQTGWPIIRLVYVNSDHYDLLLKVDARNRKIVSRVFGVPITKKTVKFSNTNQVKIIPNNQQVARAEAEAAAMGVAAAAAQRNRNSALRREKEGALAAAAAVVKANTLAQKSNTQRRTSNQFPTPNLNQQVAAGRVAAVGAQRNRNTALRREKEGALAAAGGAPVVKANTLAQKSNTQRRTSNQFPTPTLNQQVAAVTETVKSIPRRTQTFPSSSSSSSVSIGPIGLPVLAMAVSTVTCTCSSVLAALTS